ncbi:hypothetical protein [Candidatus Parabeggiatoa sp. HSG14]|uniref:hypothetical protein n=1 Tax=Candidatus Parabeggiatoa sp. HSG14 TaxID=3055593 RepID=UPI0025A8237D|nr:hypothetical protein [Thiotrichales bacterium HSG14]
MSQSVFAVITVINGDGQKVPVGEKSAEIVFIVTDELGNPNTGAMVDFSLINPMGNTITQEALDETGTPDTGATVNFTVVDLNTVTDAPVILKTINTDDDGQIFAHLKVNGLIGNYTVTATLATDSMQFANANVIIVPGTTVHFSVIEGGNQHISVDRPSADIRFKLVDVFNNPITNQAVEFYVKKPNSEFTNDGLAITTATTDVNGEVTTHLEATDIVGHYTLMAKLATNDTVTAETTVQVQLLPLSAIMVMSEKSQIVPAGSDSADIIFKITDELGNPNSGTIVNFSLVNPTGETITEDGLTIYTVDADDNGQVFTRLAGTDILGNYTITATLATDTKRFVGTSVIVVAGPAAKLIVLEEGNNQRIPASKISDHIVFKLTDAFGNGVPKQAVDFKLKKLNNDETLLMGLSLISATTDINGEVATRLVEVSERGDYTITAQAENGNISGTAHIKVTEAIPDLPSLGFGAAVDVNGNFLETDASFNGGIKVKGNDFNQEVVLNSNDSVLLQGIINVDSQHVGQFADILVVGNHQPLEPLNAPFTLYMLDNNRIIQVWDGILANLEWFMRVESLPETQIVNIHEGTLPSGFMQVYFGYRLENGLIVFNDNHAINARVKE